MSAFPGFRASEVCGTTHTALACTVCEEKGEKYEFRAVGWKRKPAEAHLVAAHKEDVCAPRWLEILTELACHGITLFLDGVVPGGPVRGPMDRGLMSPSQQALFKQQLLGRSS